MEQLVKAGIAEYVCLVVVDASASQLAHCMHPRITPVQGSLQSFSRAAIVGDDESPLFICRSVLQYAGHAGQQPWLSHVRSQMKRDEWFVHQSGCTEDLEASHALNLLFEQMDVDKWVPHKEAFVELMAQTGFIFNFTYRVFVCRDA